MNWILTRTGLRMDLLAPTAAMIAPADIAHSLSNLCRFNGHTREFYSVAQHSLIVSELVPPEHRLAALLHDATEAYLGDVTRPLKSMLINYSALERAMWLAICERFDLEPELPACVHDADLIALATERRDLMPNSPDAWDCLAGTQPMAPRINAQSPEIAAAHFHERLMSLMTTTHRARALT